jgi:hypothetical protein
MDEKIEAAIALLEEEALKSEKPPAMIVMVPDHEKSILGNKGGFLRLAVAAVRASQGQNQNLDKQPWVCNEDLDWQIEGLSYHASAHIYLPEKATKWQRRRQNAIGLTVISLLMGCLAVGFVTIVHWIVGWPKWWP